MLIDPVPRPSQDPRELVIRRQTASLAQVQQFRHVPRIPAQSRKCETIRTPPGGTLLVEGNEEKSNIVTSGKLTCPFAFLQVQRTTYASKVLSEPFFITGVKGRSASCLTSLPGSNARAYSGSPYPNRYTFPASSECNEMDELAMTSAVAPKNTAIDSEQRTLFIRLPPR
jgi:hypothetical protein